MLENATLESSKVLAFRVLWYMPATSVQQAFTRNVLICRTFAASLKEESSVEIECKSSILFVEALCSLECYDEVLVHDETQACTS